ncbi:MAG: toxin-antitoxin system protein [Rhodoluna sp.]|jgi:predicted DNA-binding protein
MAMTLRLTEELDKKLDETAEYLGLSKQQVVNKAVEYYIDEMSELKIAKKALDWTLTNDKELLERLADA